MRFRVPIIFSSRQPSPTSTPTATAVNFHNDHRPPLLLISGGKDHISPPSVVKANYDLYRKSQSITQYKEYPERTDYTLGEARWEAVADDALSWAESHARDTSVAGAV
jgi:hypothetical protein